MVGGLPCVITAARWTALEDRRGNLLVDVVGELRVFTVDEMEEHFPVALWPRQSGVYGSHRLPSPPERRFRDLAHDAPSHLRVAHDAALHLGPSGLELGLHEHDRFPPGLGESECARQRKPEADERDVADHELRREGKLAELACIRTLEHDHPWIGPQPLVELTVTDVHGNYAGGSSLKQDVRETTCRGTDVETIASRRVDLEGIECMSELLAAARDERRRSSDRELGVLVHLHPRLLISRDTSGKDERLGLRSGLGKSALDEQHV